MPAEWLTVRVVEDIQQAVEGDRPIEPVVAGLRGATLPAIVEYGCLRWAKQMALPQLPESISSSVIGKALNEVRSHLGFRFSGPLKTPVGALDEQVAEFGTIAECGDLATDAWAHFEGRFNRSAKGMGFGDRQADQMHGALHEMAENAAIHSDSTAILVGYHVQAGMAQFCVADVGRGVLASLRTCDDYAYLQRHNQAIRTALQDGTSRFGSTHGGFGFRQVFKALTAQWGKLRFRSGEGCISMDGHDLASDHGTAHFPPSLPGFQVTVTCQTTGSTGPNPLM